MTQCLNAQCLDVRSAAAAVDSLGSAVGGPPHALVKRSPLAHARGGRGRGRSAGGKKKCPRGKVFNKKKGKCVKRKGRKGH